MTIESLYKYANQRDDKEKQLLLDIIKKILVIDKHKNIKHL